MNFKFNERYFIGIQTSDSIVGTSSIRVLEISINFSSTWLSNGILLQTKSQKWFCNLDQLTGILLSFIYH